MRRIREANLNTPEGFDAIYGGPRRNEVQALMPLRTLLPLLTRGNVLDLGCGWGQYRPWVNAEFYTGIDFCRAAIAEAKTLHPGDDWYREDFSERVDSDSNQFDSVICLETLEHVEFPWMLLSEIHRVLVPGGVAILGTPYRGTLNHCEEHVWEFTEADWPNLLKEFTSHAMLRFSVGEPDMWEHFLIVARK